MSSATYKIDGLKKALQKQAPFSLLAPDQLNFLFKSSKIVKYPIGETIVRPDQFSERIYIVISGEFEIARSLKNSFRLKNPAKTNRMSGS